MFKQDELVCAVCGNTAFMLHRGQFHCSKCGAAMRDVVTTSACLQQLDNAFEPKSRS
jgi:tRNA(Ile2) C34 agmatinyltransferase TiaS